MSFKTPDEFRVTTGRLGSSKQVHGNNGMFIIKNPNPVSTLNLRVLASDGEGWEHVSVSTPSRCPTWLEMCFIKSLFWDDEDGVMQVHPPKSQWISNHPYCLHIWRPIDQEIPKPPSWMVGFKELGECV